MKTPDKILDAARVLFNEQGIRNTTTRQIAQSMGISPGNLHYHFKHTEDIIFQLYDQLKIWFDQLLININSSPIHSFSDLKPILAPIYEQVNKYRFFFIHFVDIGIWIPAIKSDYQSHLQKRAEQVEKWLDKMEVQKVIRIPNDHPKKLLISNLLIIGDFWISHNALNKELSGQSAQENFVNCMLALLRPYVL